MHVFQSAPLETQTAPKPSDEGRIRRHAVDIGKSVYRPLSAPQQIEDALTSLLSKATDIRDPFEQSFFMMVHLPYLQPFAYINKRTWLQICRCFAPICAL